MKFRVLCQGPQTGELYRNRSKCVTSGSYREVTEICALMGYYAPSSGKVQPTFRHIIGPFLWFQES